MPVIPAELVNSNPGLDTEQIIAKLLGGETQGLARQVGVGAVPAVPAAR